MLDMLRRSRSDFDTFRQIVDAKITVTDTVLSSVSRWFTNVEIVYPISVMDLGDAERRTLALSVIDEMLQSFEKAISAIESGADPDDVLKEVAGVLDPLWREIAGIYASVLNTEYEAAIAEIDPEQARRMLEEAAEALAELSGEDVETVRAHMRADETVRARLRRIGVDPDTF